MPEQMPAQSPAKLYRGISLPQKQITAEFLEAPLVPGTQPIAGQNGAKLVRDGNEYGVYMSDSQHMVETAYAEPKKGKVIDSSPNIKARGYDRIKESDVGVVYEIEPRDLPGLREPQINGPMKGHYNNGMSGSEWIADVVPPENYKVKKLVLGRDMIHQPESVEVEGDVSEALEKLRERIAIRTGRLAILSEDIAALPEWKQKNDFHVGRIIDKHENSAKEAERDPELVSV